jgi:hypothetical protein
LGLLPARYGRSAGGAEWSQTEVHDRSCGQLVKAAPKVTTGEAPSQGASPCARFDGEDAMLQRGRDRGRRQGPPPSAPQNAGAGDKQGSWLIAGPSNWPKGAMPVLGSHRPRGAPDAGPRRTGTGVLPRTVVALHPAQLARLGRLDSVVTGLDSGLTESAHITQSSCSNRGPRQMLILRSRMTAALPRKSWLCRPRDHAGAPPPGNSRSPDFVGIATLPVDHADFTGGI